nr:MAG TPA: hypothetical protein [Caudoviricetes sp.]
MKRTGYQAPVGRICLRPASRRRLSPGTRRGLSLLRGPRLRNNPRALQRPSPEAQHSRRAGLHLELSVLPSPPDQPTRLGVDNMLSNRNTRTTIDRKEPT